MDLNQKRNAQAMRRMELAEKRMQKFDQRLERTWKLVECARRIVADLGRTHAALEKSQKAFMRWSRKNGNGRKHP